MNLQEFVKNVLVGIDKAVSGAREEMQRDIRFSDAKNQRTVEFDIAVSAEETDSKNGKAGIRVLQFVEGGGELSRENKNSTISRIQFGVHIDSNTKEEDARQQAQFKEYDRGNQNSSR